MNLPYFRTVKLPAYYTGPLYVWVIPAGWVQSTSGVMVATFRLMNALTGACYWRSCWSTWNPGGQTDRSPHCKPALTFAQIHFQQPWTSATYPFSTVLSNNFQFVKVSLTLSRVDSCLLAPILAILH